MRRHVMTSLAVLIVGVAVAVMAAARVQSQDAEGAGTPAPARTPWGDPDLQGLWSFATVTPLERPAALGDREFLTPEEVAQTNSSFDNRANERPADKLQDLALAYNQEWYDRGASTGRTSLITDPRNGRLPPYTPDGRLRSTPQADGYDSWKDRPLQERCLVYRPVPVRSTGYNNHAMIVQAPGYVAILMEQIHEVRIVPLDDRPHVGEAIRPWLGDARGRWEGSTLVVETTNFHPENVYLGSGANRHVVERFTRKDTKTLVYQFTVTDPTTWTAPWSAEWPWQIAEGPMLEYACHEANYGMANLLAGERTLEKERAAASNVQSRGEVR